MSYAAAPTAYRESSVLTAPPERLVVMLYDGAHRFLFQAATLMREGQAHRAGERLSKAEAIIQELLSTLDMSAGEVATRLQAIYAFCLRLTGEARVTRDADKIDTVSGLLGELREAWAQLAGHTAE